MPDEMSLDERQTHGKDRGAPNGFVLETRRDAIGIRAGKMLKLK